MGDEESQTSTTLDGPPSRDQSEAVRHHPYGYHRLADFMGEYPDYAVYRRFGTLNSPNLLYLQAELVMLEQLLKKYAAEDTSSNAEHQPLYARNWMLLSNQGGPKSRSKKQWNLMLRIRKVLRQYSESVR